MLSAEHAPTYLRQWNHSSPADFTATTPWVPAAIGRSPPLTDTAAGSLVGHAE